MRTHSFKPYIGFFGMIKMEKELLVLYHNRRIDLRTKQDLSRYIRDEVIKEAEVIYES